MSGRKTVSRVTNETIAGQLERAAELLWLLDSNPFRARSYQNAANAVRGCEEPVAQMLERGGAAALQELPGIGSKLAGAIREIAETGRLGMIPDLEAQVSPEDVLARVPGIGEKRARQLHEELGIESLQELEQAAHDGRLGQVDGMGKKRVQGIRDALAGMLSRRSRPVADEEDQPPVGLLLGIDAEYRRKADADELPRIAPKRFNPQGEKWLPILKGTRAGWTFTALFSNTARAHELGRTHDWVVIYFEQDGEEDQCTVVSGRSGELNGRRVVRGRERECIEYYQTTEDVDE
ncbi:MAG: helix-hairpin-helix domain-containing protein [Planctomycetota bacterium]